jgi:phospholipid/cholesterol/gamma-HCH transport system permease protein
MKDRKRTVRWSNFFMRGLGLRDELQVEIDEGGTRPGTDSVRVRFIGSLNRRTTSSAFEKMQPVFKMQRPTVMDLERVTAVDSAGLALVSYSFRFLGIGQNGLTLTGVGDNIKKSFELAGWSSSGPRRDSTTEVGITEAVGTEASNALEGIFYYLHLVTETLYQAVVTPFKGEKPRVRIFFEQMSRLGAGSAPIVWLIALLVGLTTAFQAAYELRSFGANIYIADLVCISMMTELGPLMAAIIVAGRSGAAITAEIGTMQVNEEIDALRLIGINPVQYLVVPRVLAVMIAQGMLGITSAMVGIFGGFVIAITKLDLSPMAFINESLTSLLPIDVANNLIKSAIFGFLIVTVGSYYGIRVSGGAEGVGRATTNSVVTSIFLIIIADCLYSFR